MWTRKEVKSEYSVIFKIKIRIVTGDVKWSDPESVTYKFWFVELEVWLKYLQIFDILNYRTESGHLQKFQYIQLRSGSSNLYIFKSSKWWPRSDYLNFFQPQNPDLPNHLHIFFKFKIRAYPVITRYFKSNWTLSLTNFSTLHIYLLPTLLVTIPSSTQRPARTQAANSPKMLDDPYEQVMFGTSLMTCLLHLYLIYLIRKKSSLFIREYQHYMEVFAVSCFFYVLE